MRKICDPFPYQRSDSDEELSPLSEIDFNFQQQIFLHLASDKYSERVTEDDPKE